MRTAPYALSIAMTLSIISSTFAAAPDCGCENAAASACETNATCSTGCSGKHGHRCHGKKQRYEGMSRNFNCGCNGSYNYPVPPLYTYHWPGMYKQVRMTDYHSPYRFPAIRPYSDEPLSEAGLSELDTPEFLQQAAYDDDDSILVTARPQSAESSMSSKFEKLAR